MIDLFVRIIGSVVIGWALGTTAGLTVSRVFYDGGAEKLPVMLITITIIIVFLASFAVIPSRR